MNSRKDGSENIAIGRDKRKKQECKEATLIPVILMLLLFSDGELVYDEDRLELKRSNPRGGPQPKGARRATTGTGSPIA